MADTVDQATRSRIMSRVKAKHTKPEKIVRRLVLGCGYRYRLHSKDLPGKPDLVFLGRRKVIFVHGCFWHGHDCPRGNRPPNANSNYWHIKIERNRERDMSHIAKLEAEGWGVLIIWECQLRNNEQVISLIRSFLD
jgi:DNA mismatch endonuclease (patch repair protein)